jgi:hypothetical protein
MRGGSIDGVLDWRKAHQLSELVDNPDRAVTIGGQTGVLEHLVFDDELLRPFAGWWLLQSFDISGEQQWSLAGVDGPVGFSLRGVFLGADREPVVVRTARARANDFGLAPVASAAEPFGTASSLAEDQAPLSTDPVATFPSGNRTLVREYDRRPYALDGAAGSNFKTLYLLNLGATEDRTTIVLAPRLHDAELATWARYRGGDVRAYDRSEDREVYGPSHPFHTPSDLAVTNGLLRFWVGSRGLVPYLSVAAWKAGAWNEMGTVVLDVAGSPGAVLRGARLVRCTPDVATVALAVGGIGDVFVTLRRGHRHLSIAHGAGRPPLVSATRRVGWFGTPPGALTNVVTAAGRFGNGLALAALGSILFDWPRTVAVERWSVAGWWKPDAASSSKGDAGVATIFDSGGVQIGSLAWVDSSNSFVFSLGAQTVTVPASYSSGQGVGWVMAFSIEAGMALSVNVNGGAVSYAENAAHTDPNTNQATATVLGLLGAAAPGGGGPGPGALYPATDLFPATTLYPEG